MHLITLVQSTNTTLVSVSGNHGNVWLSGKVNLTSINEYKIVFEAIKGSNHTSDIGLDDIGITPGLCSLQTTPTPATATATPTPGKIND